MLTTILAVLVVFAVTGALVASRKQMDIVGFALLGIVTGVGGGTLRDLLLGATPVFWVREPSSILVCAAVACVTFFTAHIPQSRYTLVLWLDALGLAVFAVTGAETALAAGASLPVACFMGVVTATFASWLIERVQEVGDAAQAATRRDFEALAQEVAELRRAIQGRETL